MDAKVSCHLETWHACSELKGETTDKPTAFGPSWPSDFEVSVSLHPPLSQLVLFDPIEFFLLISHHFGMLLPAMRDVIYSTTAVF